MSNEKELELKRLDEEIALKSIINRALHLFPKSFINSSNEIILIPKFNEFFRLEDVDSELMFKCKMLEWLSRPISKGLPRSTANKYLIIFNQLLQTQFTDDDMYKIYGRLGNACNRELTIKFIQSNYDMSLLDKD